MHVTITGRNIDLTPALKDYFIDKLKRSEKHFDHPIEATALLTVAKNPSIANSQTAEVTVKINGSIIRGEESTENMYASIDLVADKIERQLRKYKNRYWDKANKNHHEEPEVFDASADLDSDAAVSKALWADDVRPKIVRSKRFSLKPMAPEEAVSHMDLLGHDFFVFINCDTGHVNTIYHRRDGNYGLIEPEV